MTARRLDLRTVASSGPHVRDALDLRRLAAWQTAALLPCLAIGGYRAGQHACEARLQEGTEPAGWRGAVLARLGGEPDPADLGACLWHGVLLLAPLFLAVLATGQLWQRVFFAARRRISSEGLLVTALLFTLSVPADLPLWQAVLGITFGVVLAKEVFGGTGRNFLHPALAGWAFLSFAYPGSWPGAGIPVQGSLPALGAVLGAALLLWRRLISWRILLGAALGLAAGAAAFAAGAGEEGRVPWFRHFLLGSFAFGVVFLATDPVTSPLTDAGRWIQGVLIGALTALLRFLHPSPGEAVYFAILFGNVSTPLVDHAVIRWHVRRRVRRHA